jgi:hypothetical protein
MVRYISQFFKLKKSKFVLLFFFNDKIVKKSFIYLKYMLTINLIGILHYFCAKIQIINKVNRICYVCVLKLDIFNLYTMVINMHTQHGQLLYENTKLSEHFWNPIEKSLIETEWIPLTQIHDRSIFWLGTSNSTKNGGIKLVVSTHSLVSQFTNWSVMILLDIQ